MHHHAQEEEEEREQQCNEGETFTLPIRGRLTRRCITTRIGERAAEQRGDVHLAYQRQVDAVYYHVQGEKKSYKQ